MLEQIKICLGSEKAGYVRNKHRGGLNSKKGNRYEDYFIAFKVGQIASECLGNAEANWPVLHNQFECFVDDVVVEFVERVEYYQLKNVASISWNSGDHPLKVDFEDQYKVALSITQPNPKTYLVVSEEKLSAQLAQSIPESIKKHTEVCFFPYCDGSPNRLVMEHKVLQDVLRAIAKAQTRMALT